MLGPPLCKKYLFISLFMITYTIFSPVYATPPPHIDGAPIPDPPASQELKKKQSTPECPRSASGGIDKDCQKSKKRRSRMLFTLGADWDGFRGFGALTGLRGENLAGIRGFHVGLEMSLSSLETRGLFTLEYDRPDSFYFYTEMDFSRLSWNHFEDTLQQKQLGGHVMLGRNFGRGWRIATGMKFFRYQLEDSLGMAQNIPWTPPGGWSQARTLSALRFHLSYHSDRHQEKHPTGLLNAYRFFANAEWSDPHLGSDYNYLKLDAGFDYGRFLRYGIHFSVKFRAGSYYASGNSSIPFFNRYHPEQAGMSRLFMVKGPQGIHQGQAFSLGGTGYMLLDNEVKIPVHRKYGIYIVGGLEAGALMGGAGLTREIFPQMTAKAGIQWNSPIGPLRFIWRFPIIRDPREPGVQFMFSIGL